MKGSECWKPEFNTRETIVKNKLKSILKQA